MKNGFLKVATATPYVHLADCHQNLNEACKLLEQAKEENIKVLVFPELSLTGATCGDLFLSHTLLQEALVALLQFVDATRDSDTISIVGFPLLVNDKIYNSAAICQKGQILGVVPKGSLQNYSAGADSRYFSQLGSTCYEITLGNFHVPFGEKLIFCCDTMPDLRFGVVIGDNVAAVSARAFDGATLIVNPVASHELVVSEENRINAFSEVTDQCACLYANCGKGESTTDLVFSGHSLICECGNILAAKKPFDFSDSLLTTEIDLQKICYVRRVQNAVATSAASNTVRFSLDMSETSLTRDIDANPFLPKKADLAHRAKRILDMQGYALAQRIEKAYAQSCVIGISGGLDSCLALLATVRAMDILCRPRTDVIAVTMPCFGTTKRTRSNAEILCETLGVSFITVDISESVRKHFADIGHDESIRDVTYENAQARERTQVLMDIANEKSGLVIGTGDLSELALGWATYNGDHMSMYAVNAGIPKTLIRHIVAWYADNAEERADKSLADVLRDILDTPVSPELLPADHSGNIAQITEDLVGPYELHDFYLYYMLRYGFAPDKLYRMAKYAFAGKYDNATLLKWLKNFIRRFFAQQFKRSCLPDGPKVGSVGVSPRGDWKMPSDACASMWIKMVDNIIE